jgi:hypothetical protein
MIGHTSALTRVPAAAKGTAHAHLYTLALEKGSAGARYHAIAEEGVPLRQIAEVIGRRLNLPIVSKSPEEAADVFAGWRSWWDATVWLQAQSRRNGWVPRRKFAERIDAHLAAGARHVCLLTLRCDGSGLPDERALEALARR